jgi:hypothetical protein
VKQVSARRAAPKPLQGPMLAKIASRAEVHVMSRGQEDFGARQKGKVLGQGAGSRTEEGAVATAEKRSATTLVLFACLLTHPRQHQIHTIDLSSSGTTRPRLSTPTFTSNPNHDRHPPSRNPRPGAIPQKADPRLAHCSRYTIQPLSNRTPYS